MLKFCLSSVVGVGAGAFYTASGVDAQPCATVSSSSSSSGFAECAAAASSSGVAAPGACQFNPDEWQSFRLLSSKYETHDTRRFFFALPNPKAPANLPIGSCVLVKYHDNQEGKDIIRPYTPINNNTNNIGTTELLIKRYPKSKMGHHIHTLRPGEDLQFKGPIVKFDYKPNKFKHIGCIAGGTGITPMFQFVQGICENSKVDKTRISLVYSNKSRNDLLLATELSEFQKSYNQFHLYMTLTQTTPFRWLGGIGHVSKPVLEATMPKPGEKNTVVFVCGPPTFMKAISGDKDFSSGSPKQGEIGGLLKEMGYKSDQVFKF